MDFGDALTCTKKHFIQQEPNSGKRKEKKLVLRTNQAKKRTQREEKAGSNTNNFYAYLLITKGVPSLLCLPFPFLPKYKNLPNVFDIWTRERVHREQERRGQKNTEGKGSFARQSSGNAGHFARTALLARSPSFTRPRGVL